MTTPQLTEAQQHALMVIEHGGWTPDTTTMHYALGEGKDGRGCVMVLCRGQQGSEITFGIEVDGYAHT